MTYILLLLFLAVGLPSTVGFQLPKLHRPVALSSLRQGSPAYNQPIKRVVAKSYQWTLPLASRTHDQPIFIPVVKPQNHATANMITNQTILRRLLPYMNKPSFTVGTVGMYSCILPV